MTIHHLKTLGVHWDPAAITVVSVTPGKWKWGDTYGHRKPYKKGLFKWRHWQRPWRYYRKPTLNIWLVGDRYPVEREYRLDSQAFAARDALKAEVNALLAAPSTTERIVAAAIVRVEQDRSGLVDKVKMTYSLPAPARHHHILHSMPPRPGEHGVHDVEQGFITSTGRFVGRVEAMGLAVAAGQVPPGKVTTHLFSEDLW